MEACERKSKAVGMCIMSKQWSLDVFLFLWLILAYERQQLRRRQADPCAQTAVPSTNLARLVVVVLAVLGSETAEVLVTENFVTRGTRALWFAKHELS